MSSFFVYHGKLNKDILTMWGIFGTFCGIVGGLYFFNDSEIEKSIPHIISGLKTAFYTSIAGLTASIIMEGLISFKNKEENKDEEYLLSDISKKLSILIDFQDGIKELPIIKQELLFLNKNIGGEGETSLLTQIQKLRTTFSDKQDELRKSFDDFAEKMAENNMKGLIEAIKQVMEDFNTKINDQLGQSFKELTNAIDNLLKWQDEYKNNIVISTEALNLSKDSLEKSSKGFEITVEKAEKFSGISESLGNELKYLNDSLEILKSGLKEFDGIANNNKESSIKLIESIESLKNNFVSKAEIMVSESENHIKNMKEGFEKQSKDLIETHKNILENTKIENKNILEILGKELKIITNDIGEKFKNISSEFIEINKKFIENSNTSISQSGEQVKLMNDIFKNQSTDLKDAHKNILEDLKNNVDNTNKNVSEQFERIANELERQVGALDNNFREHYAEFDKKLEEELTKSLSSLGRELTSVSEHFVTDYSNLAQKLESLINNK